MNQQMWAHAAVQANLATAAPARRDGARSRVREPGLRRIGLGRYARVTERNRVRAGRALKRPAPAGRAARAGQRGPTYEDIDPVRFLGNRSSGRMGTAVAEAAAEQGPR
jgi:phosphopantothenoylcysteine decarboxylase/phosphopantothenate--cysteine ligase